MTDSIIDVRELQDCEIDHVGGGKGFWEAVGQFVGRLAARDAEMREAIADSPMLSAMAYGA